MTQQYLLGEVLLILADLQAAASAPKAADDVEALRHTAENVPLGALPVIVERAEWLVDAWCWDSLARGDVDAFDRQAAAGAELFEFGVCSGLIVERDID